MKHWAHNGLKALTPQCVDSRPQCVDSWAQGVTIPEKCVIIGIAVRWRERVAETLLKEDER
jgi:hypothetical protein